MERQKRPKLAGAGTLATFWEALFFGPFKATVIVRRVSRIAKSDCQLHRVVSLCLSAWNISAPTGQILMKFDI